MAKTSREYSKKYGTVQIWADDKCELDRVQEKSGKARVWLMREAVMLLKKKYRVKDEGVE